MAQVYVGTYKKYNEGSINGGWLDLADYKTYDDFLKACRRLHKNERDPEFMIQDTQDFPDGLSCLEWLGRKDFDDVKQAMAEEQGEKPSVSIVEYSEKAFAVVGDTFEVRDQLKKMGGAFNRRLSCGAGWIFSNKAREAVETFISTGMATCKAKAENKATKDGQMFIDWLNEFFANGGDEYYKKYAVGAIKMHERYYLIEKPSIDNKFCFHDEGPQYEFYKELMEDKEKRLAEYFKSENLAQFDNKIERIEKGDEYNNDKRVWWYNSGTEHKICLQFYTDTWDEDKKTLCTEEEKQLILKGLKFGRAMFEKRLDAYLNRYGVSKIHTWTYWADA